MSGLDWVGLAVLGMEGLRLKACDEGFDGFPGLARVQGGVLSPGFIPWNKPPLRALRAPAPTLRPAAGCSLVDELLGGEIQGGKIV